MVDNPPYMHTHTNSFTRTCRVIHTLQHVVTHVHTRTYTITHVLIVSTAHSQALMHTLNAGKFPLTCTDTHKYKHTHRNPELYSFTKAQSTCTCVCEWRDLTSKNTCISKLLDAWKGEPSYNLHFFQPRNNHKDNIYYNTQHLKCAVNIAT